MGPNAAGQRDWFGSRRATCRAPGTRQPGARAPRAGKRGGWPSGTGGQVAHHRAVSRVAYWAGHVVWTFASRAPDIAAAGFAGATAAVSAARGKGGANRGQ